MGTELGLERLPRHLGSTPKHQQTDLPSSNRHRELVAPVGLAVRDRAGVVALVDPAGRDRVDQVGRAALAERVGRVGLADMNRVAPGVMEDMDLADRVGLGVPNQAGRAALADRVGREARDPSLGRALLDRMPTALDPTPADLDRTRPADRLWKPTTRVEATRPEARMRRAEATHLAGATHLAEVTDSSGGADASGELIVKAISQLNRPSCAQLRSRLSAGMATNHRL